MSTRMLVGVAVLMLSACNAPEPEKSAEETRGREETRNIRNTENIGVSGEAMADRLDQSLDAADKHAEAMKQAEEQASGENP